MRPIELGSTGLRVTPIGLGLAAVGRPAYINLGHDADLGVARSVDSLRERAHEVMNAAYEAGIRYFDAARSYGRAEEFLASWLGARSLAPGDVAVGSKWGYTYTADWRADAEVHEVKDHSIEAFQRQHGETRALLGDYLRLYQIHSATLDTGVLDDKAVLAALVELGEKDVAVGLSVSGARQPEIIRRALGGEVDGVNPFSSVQATWNVLEPSAGPALAEASAAGWGVIVKEAMANGRLVRAAGEELPVPSDFIAIAKRSGVAPDALAIAAALAQPFADVVLSGAATAAQLQSNAAALDLQLSPGDLSELHALGEPPEEYWTKRSSLPWT